MSKNYQRRENFNAIDNTIESTPVDTELDTSVVGHPADVVPASMVVMAEPMPLPVAPPVTPPVVDTKKVTMLPVQSELVALAQAINPKQPIQPRWQYTLFQLLKSVIEKEDNAAFHQQWAAVLKFYHTAKGTAFSDSYMLRFSDDWPGSEHEFSLFRRLVHIVSATSDPQTRQKAATMINFTRATEGLKEDARNRLIGFYG